MQFEIVTLAERLKGFLACGALDKTHYTSRIATRALATCEGHTELLLIPVE